MKSSIDICCATSDGDLPRRAYPKLILRWPTEPIEPTGFFAKIWNAIKGFLGIGTSNEPTPEGDPSDGKEIPAPLGEIIVPEKLAWF
jgi:hypothetical protein